MEKKNTATNNNFVIILLVIIIIILLILCYLFATNKLILNTGNNSSNSNIDKTINNPTEKATINYTDLKGEFIGENGSTFTISNITEKEITFEWSIFRCCGTAEETTIPYDNGKAVFYYQGYDDKNLDSQDTEDEKFIRKATIYLTNNEVTVTVEDVLSIDNGYSILDMNGGSYLESGTYTYSK